MKKATENPGKRLVILGDEEIDALYGRPRFTPEEREECFALSAEENATLTQLHSLKSRMFFILQLGYFKARRMFFAFDLQDAKEDAAHIRQKYFLTLDVADPELAKGTRLKQQRLILNLCKYRHADTAIRQNLEVRARQAAAVCGKPIYVFRQLMDHLAEQRIIAPGYSVMQTIVGGALAHEQRRLASIVNTHVNSQARAALDHLLENPQGLHAITLLK